MKKFATLLLLLITTGNLHAQHVTVQLDKMNVAYVGVNNPISVSADNFSCDQLVVKVNDKELAGMNCEYNFSPGETGMATLSVYGKQGSRLKKIGEMNVRVKGLPDLIVSIGGQTNGFISPDVLTASDGLEYNVPWNCDVDLRETISTFTIAIYSALDSEQIFQRTYTNKGTKFDEETRKMFRQLKRNDLVIISDIRTQGPDIPSRKLSDVTLRIFN